MSISSFIKKMGIRFNKNLKAIIQILENLEDPAMMPKHIVQPKMKLNFSSMLT
jgi:hypothetical protein